MGNGSSSGKTATVTPKGADARWRRASFKDRLVTKLHITGKIDRSHIRISSDIIPERPNSVGGTPTHYKATSTSIFSNTPTNLKSSNPSIFVQTPTNLTSSAFISRPTNLKISMFADNSPISACSGDASPHLKQKLPEASNRRSMFKKTNDFVFQHVTHDSKPLNFGSPSMTQDTFDFLDNFKDSEMATILRDLYFGQSYSIEGKEKKVIDTLAMDFARLSEYCLDKMLSATMLGDRIVWQTRLCNLIHQVYQSEFGDIVMKFIKERINVLLQRFPVISENESDAQKQAGLGDLGVVILKDAKLSNYMSKLRQEKYSKKTNKDREFECMNGQVAIPSELSALDEILDHSEKIQGKFGKDLKEILEKEGGTKFKCNVKGYDRAAYKLNEYAAKKPRPSFDHLFDMVRCRAVYKDVANIKKVIMAISKKYKIVNFKDKINTPLKNVTLNIVYQEAIAEVQLACGTVASEYHSHRLYEIFRCLTMKEIFDVVMGWGDYNFDEFKPCNFWILPTKNLEPKSLFSMQENVPHAILKSMEQGVIDEEHYNIDCEDNPRSACWQNIQQLVCQYNEKNIQSVSLTGIQVPGDFETQKHILPHDDLIQNITGTFSDDGIKSLEFLTKKNRRIQFGKVQGDKKFDMKIPKHMTVLGLYYTWNEAGVQSIACWFGEKPAISKIQAISNPQDALPDIGLRCRCETCNYQLYWEWSDEKDRRCHICRTEIHKNAGYADCIRSSNPVCSCCYSKMAGAKELPNILKLKCPKGTLYKWKYKSIEGFKCSDCHIQFNDKTGYFINESATSKLCSGCYKKKGAIQERIYYDTYPVVQVDKPCGKCSKDLMWYWNVKLLGRVTEEFTCEECDKSYPLSAGCYNCKACEYEVCSTCYRNAEDTSLQCAKMPNFLRKKCPYSHYLTWQFTCKAPWMCNLCEVSYPPSAGCYTCPDADCAAYKECSACYLQPYINFRYDEYNPAVVSQEQIELMLRFGKFKADVKCELCTGACYWLWNTKIIPGYEAKDNFICNSHKGEVPHNFGAYHCFKCNLDICSECYYVTMKKSLPALPFDRKKCTGGNKMSWKSNFGANWNCSKCNSTSPGKQSGYVCITPKCSCEGYKMCPGCYIENDVKIPGGIECDDCNGGYHWTWDMREIKEDYSDGFRCTYCYRQTGKTEGGFHCDNGCPNDVCYTCMEKRSEDKKMMFPSKAKCSGNTIMVWKNNSETTWYCQWCLSKMSHESGAYSCYNLGCKCKASKVCSSCYGNYHL